jgi:hypothetical protein
VQAPALPPQLDEIARELQADVAKAATESAAENKAAIPPAEAIPATDSKAGHNYRADKTDGATTAAAMTEAPVTSTVNMFKVPSRKRSAPEAEAAKAEPEVTDSPAPDQADGESTDSDVPEKMPSFGELTHTRRPAAIWVAAVGGILLCAAFAGIYHSSAKASNTPGGAANAKTDTPDGAATTGAATAPSVPAQPLPKQAVEGTQRLTALDLERCQRVNPGSIECWGYVSNVGTDPSRISLQSVDVVDGKGNTFNLRGVGQLDFATGRSSNITGGSREKYTVKVPDKDPNAKTLTLYVDVANPHALEFTFRDIPIS